MSKKKWGIGPIADFIDAHGLREKYDALDPPKIAPVVYQGKTYRFYIPDAMHDKMQLPPLMGHFHEIPLLQQFQWVVDPGGTICDLGANFGSHTLFFAAVMKAKHVHAFEPQPNLVKVIRKTLDLNNVTTVDLHQMAVGARAGKVRLKSENTENSGMTEFRPGGDDATIPMCAVDDIVGDEWVSGIKMDVEGMQMPALRGLSKTIRRCRPVLWLELRPAKGELEKPTQWLGERGYHRHQVSFRDFFFLPKQD